MNRLPQRTIKHLREVRWITLRRFMFYFFGHAHRIWTYNFLVSCIKWDKPQLCCSSCSHFLELPFRIKSQSKPIYKPPFVLFFYSHFTFLFLCLSLTFPFQRLPKGQLLLCHGSFPAFSPQVRFPGGEERAGVGVQASICFITTLRCWEAVAAMLIISRQRYQETPHSTANARRWRLFALWKVVGVTFYISLSLRREGWAAQQGHVC